MRVPDTMPAIDPEQPGGPEILQLTTRPVPRPAAGEVLIEVHAAGVNRADILQRQGRYPVPPGSSAILGLEAAGTIAAIGEDVTGFAIGDKVTALVAGGAYAGYLTAPACQCLPVPAGMPFAAAATLPETWFTVWSNLHDLAGAKAGETLLVHGGTSGIGTTAIDYARLFGLSILVTCGSDGKCEAARRLGAALAINYSCEDFVARILEHTNGRGVDLVLDMVGGDYLRRNMLAMAVGGRHVSIAFQNGHRPELDLMLLARKRLFLTGSLLRPRGLAEKTAIRDALLRHVWPHFADGMLRSHLFQSFPLEKAADAHRLLEAGGHIGKLALVVRD